MATDILKDYRAKCQRFIAEKGLPTLAQEDYKYTDLSALTDWPLTASGETSGNEKLWRDYQVCANLIVFQNGKPVHTELPSSWQGVTVQPFSTVEELPAELVRLLVPAEHHSYISVLNGSYFTSGLIVRVGRGINVPEPLQLIFAQSSSQPITNFTRLVVVLEEGASCSLVETYVGEARADNYLSCVQTNIVLKEQSQLRHKKIGFDGAHSYHLGCTTITQAAHSNYAQLSLFFGGKLVRNEISTSLQGVGANVNLRGLSKLDNDQLVDNFITVEHVAPHCTSNQRFKGIYNGKSHGVFTGVVVVREGAQKTNAYQSNANILLSPEAKVDARPQLKIWADDVKCSHGETCGALDEEALFFLQSRGIPKAQAQQILLEGFAAEILSQVPSYLEPLIRRAIK